MTLIPLMFFMMLAPVVFEMWVTDGHVRARAHRDTFMRAFEMQNMSKGTDGLPFLLDFLNFNKAPKKSALPKLKPKPDKSLGGYTQFANKWIEGWDKEKVTYSTGFTRLKGNFDVARRAAVIRSTWTWSEWPFIPSQAMGEKKKVKNWYKKAYEKTHDNNLYKKLYYNKKPL